MRRISTLALLLACRTAVEPTPPAAADERGDVPEADPPAAVTALVKQVDGKRLHATVSTLAGFGTRHTLSAIDGKRGIGAARRWIKQELESYGGRLQVRFDPHTVEPDGRRIPRTVDVVNVVATLPGSMPEAAARHYYVIGHYDSRASDPMERGVGRAGGPTTTRAASRVVMELARIMANAKLDATVVFMATAGEEQGLIGADRHARAAREANIDIRGVLSNDIVGDPTAPSGGAHDKEIRVFSAALDTWLQVEDLEQLRKLSATNDSPNRQLARFVDTVARWHDLPVKPRLIFRHDRFLRGGDHTAFNRSGFTRRPPVRSRGELRPPAPGRPTRGRHPSSATSRRNVDPTYLAGVAPPQRGHPGPSRQRPLLPRPTPSSSPPSSKTTRRCAGRRAPSPTSPATRSSGARPPARSGPTPKTSATKPKPPSRCPKTTSSSPSAPTTRTATAARRPSLVYSANGPCRAC